MVDIGSGSAPKKSVSLQDAFADWKKRNGSRAQPKDARSGAAGAKGSKGGGSGGVGAKRNWDAPKSEAKPPKAYVAEAYREKDVRTLLDTVVDWYTTDKVSMLDRKIENLHSQNLVVF